MEKSRKSGFFCQKLTNFHCMPILWDFSQKSRRIVYEKMPDNHLSETFFKIWLSSLLLELRRHEMLQTRWNILYPTLPPTVPLTLKPPLTCLTLSLISSLLLLLVLIHQWMQTLADQASKTRLSCLPMNFLWQPRLVARNNILK